MTSWVSVGEYSQSDHIADLGGATLFHTFVWITLIAIIIQTAMFYSHL